MPTINITVKNKRAVGDGSCVVCNNSDYIVNVNFDAEWSNYEIKTMRVKFTDGTYYEDVFSGNSCALPIINNQTGIEVGFYAGNLKTTTGAYFDCKKSILYGSGTHTEPPEDVYNQLVELADETRGIAQSVRDDADNGEFTPVRGIDYWTEADKEEINADNITYISAEFEKHIVQTTGDSTTAVMSQKAVTAEINALKSDLTNFSLGVHTDGFLYIFYKGNPIGSGVSLPSGVTGDVVGNVDSENNIIVTGALADGTYTVKYEMEDGTTIDIGELVLDSNVYYSITNNLTNCVNSNSATQVISGNSYSATITAKSGYELSSVVVTMGGSPVSVSGGVISIASVTGNIVITAVAEESGTAYTNLLPLAVDASGNAFVGTNGERGYKTGYRINSRGAEVAASGVECTGFMPYTSIYDTIYVKGISLAATETHNNLVFYDSSKAYIKNLYISEASASFVLNGDTWKISPSKQINNTGIAYFRFCAGSITDATIVTVNEEIV